MSYKNVDDLLKSRSLEAQNQLSVYNPMFDPFVVEYDGVKYSVEPQSIAKFPFHIGKHVIKHLRDQIINLRGYSSSIEEERKKVEKEIIV